MADFPVGQVLYFVPTRGLGHPADITILAIGRRWYRAEWFRRSIWIDKQSLNVMGERRDVSIGHAYLSREAYEGEQERQREWIAFTRSLQYTAPWHLTLQRIRQIRAEIENREVGDATSHQH